MAYLIFADDRGELARHPLSGAVIIGRSPECTVMVRDILLSRKHCKIEPMLDRWVLSDLASKNGTYIENQKIDRRTLEDGDVIRFGKTQMCFRAGAFVPAAPGSRPVDSRPIDPREALAGTVAGFRVEPSPKVDTKHFPKPQPRPAEPSGTPTSYDAASLVTGLSSSQWDELIARGAGGRAARPLPKVSVNEDRAEPSRVSSVARARRRRLALVASIAVAIIVIALLVAMAWR
jgi:hypothetical protein